MILTLKDDNALNPKSREFTMTLMIFEHESEIALHVEDSTHLWSSPITYGEERPLEAEIISVERIGIVNV